MLDVCRPDGGTRLCASWGMQKRPSEVDPSAHARILPNARYVFVNSQAANLPEGTEQFYRETIGTLQEAELPFMIGGAYAFSVYTGIKRHTKDLDFFVRPADVDRVLDQFRAAGYEAKRTFPHWLAKVKCDGDSLDLIYRAGNGLCEIDDSWFDRAVENDVFGTRALLCAPEEMLWMKAYIMERERFDGADLMHLIQSCAERLEWKHLIRRFRGDWRVLLSHLVLFGFVYPAERNRIPAWVMSDLLRRIEEELASAFPERVCRGTLLSRAQYLTDVQERGYRDARLQPASHMNAADIER